MTRQEASEHCFNELIQNGLNDWHVRLTTNINDPFLGLCSHKDKCIILNAHHIDIHPNAEIIDTIKHEVAHALVGPEHGHDIVWSTKAREIGCTNTLPCSHLSFSPAIIDAIRSGADVKVEFEEETHIIRRPKYEITRLQDKCPYCGKVAKEKTVSFLNFDYPAPDKKFITLECGHTLIKDIPKGTPFHLFVTNRDEDRVKNCNHKWEKTQCLKCGEYKLYDFQLLGAQFGERALSVNKGFALFDGMGLGKTPESLAVVYYVLAKGGPTLYIVKSAVKFQWAKQIIRWMGPDYVPQIIESSNDFLIPNLKSYIIGFDMLVPKVRQSKKSGKVIKQGFDITKLDFISNVVIDECQHIKNPDSSRTQQVRKVVKDKKVIILSGTPWKNRGSEFFSGLNMIAPMKFPSFEGFKKQWVSYYVDDNGKMKEGGIRDIERFKDYIADIAIRRERVEVLSELPLINRMKLYIELNQYEQKTYDDEVSDFVKWYNSFVLEGREHEINSINILAKMARMRHIVGLAKIPATMEFIEEFIDETDESLLIGVHHKDVAMIFHDELVKKHPQIQILSLSSSLNSFERFEIIKKFNSKRSILIASILAGGEGVDGLQDTCSNLIMHERQFNPANEEQFEDRLIRIGQESNSVNGTYPQAEGSIDEIFDEIVERKRRMFHDVMNKSELNGWKEEDVVKAMAAGLIKKFNERNKMKKNELVMK